MIFSSIRSSGEIDWNELYSILVIRVLILQCLSKYQVYKVVTNCMGNLIVPFSELCVNSFRSFAPKNESKLGLRVATRLTRNSCLSPSVVMMALIYLKRLREQGKLLVYIL